MCEISVIRMCHAHRRIHHEVLLNSIATVQIRTKLNKLDGFLCMQRNDDNSIRFPLSANS